MSKCSYCGSPISGRSSRARYCSDSCKTQASKKRRVATVNLADLTNPMAIMPSTNLPMVNTTVLLDKFTTGIVSRAGSQLGDAIGKTGIPKTNDTKQRLIHYGAQVTGGGVAFAVVKRIEKKSGERKSVGDYVMAIGLGIAAGELTYRGYELVMRYIEEKREETAVQQQQQQQQLEDGQMQPAVIMPATEMAVLRQPIFSYFGRYSYVIGNELSVPFQIAVFGAPGHGKSHVAAELAADFARSGNVLFVLTEEMLNHNVQRRLQRYGIDQLHNVTIAVCSNIQQFAEVLKSQMFRFVIIDSLSALTPGADRQVEVMKALRMYKQGAIWGVVAVVQVNKDDSIRGSNELLHVVDTVVEVKNYIAKATFKNRFGGRGELAVFPENEASGTLIDTVINNTQSMGGNVTIRK